MTKDKYSFVDIDNCNMCKYDTHKGKIMGHRLNKSVGLKTSKATGISVSVIKCGNCGLIYNNPLPIPNSISQHYDMEIDEYWDHVEELMDLNNQKEAIDKFKDIKKINSSIPNLTALDIGSGLGQTMLSLRNYGFDVYGLEPSSSFYNKAIELTGLKEDKFQLSSIENANYKENSFDYISFLNVLEHLYDPNEALIKTVKWLKPGGLMFVCIPYSNWLTGKLINLFYKIRATSFVTNTSPMHVPFHLYEFSKESFLENAKMNGYEVVSSQVKDSMSINSTDRFLSPIKKITKTGLRLDVWIRKADEV